MKYIIGIKRYIFLIFLSFPITLLYADIGLEYLNTLRTQTGLEAFVEETHLHNAAQNHSDYMRLNNTVGHYEQSGKDGYTGDAPVDRVLSANYFSRVTSENVSAGQTTVQASIDGLFSAIYHRYGFLSLEKDEIGIGIGSNNNKSFYTYDIGNSGVNSLCQGDASSSGYKGICKDADKVIDSTEYNNAMNADKGSAPELIVWPAVDSADIPPVFYEESPDPLPNDSVTGYPVSVEFNDEKFTTAPTVSHFILSNAQGGVLEENIVLMNKENDPNSRFTAYQATIFPKNRLEWGEAYHVELGYVYGDENSTKNWCFETRSLENRADRFYRIAENADISLDAVSDKSYAMYVVPNDSNDSLGSVSFSYTTDAPEFSYIDSNTFSIKVTGDTGEYIKITFNNGQKIKLTISDTDTAEMPHHITCAQVDDYDEDGILNSEDLDDDNDGYSDIDENNAGSNSLDAKDTPLDTDGDMIPNYRDTDDDNDGILDTVEIANGLDPLNASDAQSDLDGDGFSNSMEISLGTDMHNANSTPLWVPIFTGNGLLIIVPVAP